MITIDNIDIYPDNENAPSLYAIGWGLARTGRFASQTHIWYPVLPHVYSVTAIVSEEAKIHAMLHDAAECVVGDQVATWKNKLTGESEDIILDRIYLKLELIKPTLAIKHEVYSADIACRSAEAKLLGHAMGDHPHFTAIRDTMPELYERALEETRNRIAIYNSKFCIEETNTLALRYEASVMKTLNRVTA